MNAMLVSNLILLAAVILSLVAWGLERRDHKQAAFERDAYKSAYEIMTDELNAKEECLKSKIDQLETIFNLLRGDFLNVPGTLTEEENTYGNE